MINREFYLKQILKKKHSIDSINITYFNSLDQTCIGAATSCILYNGFLSQSFCIKRGVKDKAVLYLLAIELSIALKTK